MRLVPAEVLIAIGCFVVFLLYVEFQLPLLDFFERYLQRLKNFFLYYTFGLLVVFLLLRLRLLRRRYARGRKTATWRATWRRFRRLYLSPRKILSDLRWLNLVALLFVTFIHLKHLTPFVNPLARSRETVHDVVLFPLEASWFGDGGGTAILQEFFGRSESMARILSSAYTAFYGYLALVILIFVFQRNRLLAEEFFFSFSLLWLVGVSIVYLYPTWGPCFFAPESVIQLPRTDVSELQRGLWRHFEALQDDLYHRDAVYLISGFPSLHLAAVVLGTLALRHIAPILGILSGIFSVMTAITTIYFGWHYVVDDIAAVLLAGGVSLFARYVFRRDQRVSHLRRGLSALRAER